ncbi:MAG: hypothetical protein U1E73_03060 [Planctomycetota bacterium]
MRGQIAEAHVAVEAGERITSVSERELHAVPALGGVAMQSSSTIETSRGREWVVQCLALLSGSETGGDALMLTAI